MNGENDTMYYVHKDYLGSYDVITNEGGHVLERLSFDPWGRRRNPADWTFDNVPANHLFDRGYTGHEHLDVFSLINMYGRAYDPWLGRFLSPDPVVQSPGYSQSYNRYSYCFNNPLKYTDPIGYNASKSEENPIQHGAITSFLGYQGYMGAGSMYHWSDRLRSIEGNFNIMSESRFVSMYSRKEYNRQLFNNAVTTYTGKAAQSLYLDLTDNRMNVYIISAFGHNTLVSCFGKLGPVEESSDGALYSNNPTAHAYIPEANIIGERDRHITANDLWNITMGGAGTLADVTSNGLHNSIYWVQKNGKVSLTKNIGNNYLLKRSFKIVEGTLQNGKLVAKSLSQLNIAYAASDYALTLATTSMPSFGQGMDLFFTSVAAIPGAGWAVSSGYWVISAGSYAITGKWMSEHMDSWVY